MPKIPVTPTMGAAIKSLRQRRNYKAVDLAAHIGKTGSYISKLEKGELNTIEQKDFVTLIKKMSKTKEEFAEAIDILLEDTTIEYSEEESKKEKWRLDLDYFYRILPLKNEYKTLIKTKMEELKVSPTELSNYINANPDIYADNSLDKRVLDSQPRNEWIFNNGNSYVLMEITPDEINDIINPEKSTSSYAYMFCILMSLYRLEKFDKSKAYKQAHDDLSKMKIFTIRDKELVMQTFGEEEKIHDLLSQRNNTNLPLEDQKLLSSLYDFTKHIHAFSQIDINYTNEKMTSINNLLKKDAVIALKLLGTDISPLIEKPTSLKKDFFKALEDLIQEYGAKEIIEKPELL